MRPIYPEVETIQTDDAIELKTKLVKESDGKYYYLNFYKKYKVDNIYDIISAVNRFHKEVYHVIILGKVDTNLKMPDGSPSIELAEEQITEEQRVRDYLYIF